MPVAPNPVRVPITRLPFVGDKADGRMGYWVLPEVGEGADMRLVARTYVAWFMIYAEANGQDAARDLMDRIELEMPSRYPAIDRIFLRELADLWSPSP